MVCSAQCTLDAIRAIGLVAADEVLNDASWIDDVLLAEAMATTRLSAEHKVQACCSLGTSGRRTRESCLVASDGSAIGIVRLDEP